MLHAVCFYSMLAAMVAQWFWGLAAKPKDTGLICRDGNIFDVDKMPEACVLRYGCTLKDRK